MVLPLTSTLALVTFSSLTVSTVIEAQGKVVNAINTLHEEIKKKYRKFEYLIKTKNSGKSLTLDSYYDINIKDDSEEYNFSVSTQSGYSSVIIISMIVITILVAGIMLYIKFKN